MKHLLTLFLVLITFSSCNSKKAVITKKKGEIKMTTKKPVISKPTTTKPTNNSNLSSVELYINDFRDIAMDEMKNYGIPASITLAQGILESGSGKGRLSVEANNHFGIKCHGWKGEKIYHDDDVSQECFRKYKDAKYSFRDHSLFLKDRKRYYKLFQLKKDDYKNWAKGLKKAGYATDPKYPNKLISLIERYNLTQYDAQVLGKNYIAKKPKRNNNNNSSLSHKVAKGDTLYSLSKKYNTTVENIKRLNQISGNSLSIGQNLIIKL